MTKALYTQDRCDNNLYGSDMHRHSSETRHVCTSDGKIETLLEKQLKQRVVIDLLRAKVVCQWVFNGKWLLVMVTSEYILALSRVDNDCQRRQSIHDKHARSCSQRASDHNHIYTAQAWVDERIIRVNCCVQDWQREVLNTTRWLRQSCTVGIHCVWQPQRDAHILHQDLFTCRF